MNRKNIENNRHTTINNNAIGIKTRKNLIFRRYFSIEN